MICCPRCGRLCREVALKDSKGWVCTECGHALSEKEIEVQEHMLKWHEEGQQRKARIPKMPTKELIEELTEPVYSYERTIERVALARLLYWTQHIYVKSGCFSSEGK